MKIVDANIILRYLLNDIEDLSEKAAELLEHNEVVVPNEVIAEVVYVLEKIYKVEHSEISNALKELFSYNNLHVNNTKMINEALKLYGEGKFDFVDTLLYAYYKVEGHEVYTFDRKLNNLLKHDEKK